MAHPHLQAMGDARTFTESAEEREIPPISEFLVCAPYYLSTREPNNKLMEDLASRFPRVDRRLAFQQFHDVYKFVSDTALLHILPSVSGLQDQVYVSNLGIVMGSGTERTVVLSNFKSAPRRGEELIGQRFFEGLGLRTEMAPAYFEGEADLKVIAPSTYVGAHGMRTCLQALRWFRNRFDVEVVECELTNPYLYHLDCVLFSLSETELLAATDWLCPSTLKSLERVADIVHVPTKAALAGATNCVRIQNHIICDDNRRLFADLPELHQNEEEKLTFLGELCERRKLSLKTFEMTEFVKSGAAMSCLFMRLGE
jgi:N-dimethylarginine dimethylaminohydrolase